MSSKKIKILYVITSLRVGGAEKLVVDLSLRLKNEGHEVEIFVIDGTHTPFTRLLEENGVRIHKAAHGYSQMWNPWHYRKLKALLQINHYDIVHSHNTTAQIITYLAGSKLKNNSRFITTEHNTYNRRRRIPLLKILDRKMYDFYEKVACVSETTRKNLLCYLSKTEEAAKYITIFNGIDISKFRAARFDKPNEHKDKIIMLMVAAFRKQKDQPTLIRALKHLPEKYIVWFAGDGSRRQKCEKLVKELGLDSRVKFLGNRTDIPELYSQVDIIVISSHYEGMSLASIEALASGKPFIASNVAGLREIAEGCGLVFERSNDRDLAEKILSVGEDENLGREISEACLKRGRHYDLDRTYSLYLNLYNNLIDF